MEHASNDTLLADRLLHIIGRDDVVASREDRVARDAELQRNLASIEVGFLLRLLVGKRVGVLQRVLAVLNKEVAGVAFDEVVDELGRCCTLPIRLKPLSLSTGLTDKRVFTDTTHRLDVLLLLLDSLERGLRSHASDLAKSFLGHLGDLHVNAKASHARDAKRTTDRTHRCTLQVEADLGQVGRHIRQGLHPSKATTGSVDALFGVPDLAVDVDRSLTLHLFGVDLLVCTLGIASNLSLPRVPKLNCLVGVGKLLPGQLVLSA